MASHWKKDMAGAVYLPLRSSTDDEDNADDLLGACQRYQDRATNLSQLRAHFETIMNGFGLREHADDMVTLALEEGGYEQMTRRRLLGWITRELERAGRYIPRPRSE